MRCMSRAGRELIPYHLSSQACVFWKKMPPFASTPIYVVFERIAKASIPHKWTAAANAAQKKHLEPSKPTANPYEGLLSELPAKTPHVGDSCSYFQVF